MNNTLYESSSSITHRHLLASLNSIIKNEYVDNTVIRILDAGCGQCVLMEYLQKYLPELTGKTIELYGYDVSDHGVQAAGYFETALTRLNEACPGIPWESRVKCIRASDSWPFQDNFFDIVISNQVLEHVWDHDTFIFENKRVLKQDGCALHLFPVKECIVDWHLFLPFVHWIRSWHLLYRYVKWCSRLGFGIYRNRKEELDTFSVRHADYIWHFTNYIPSWKLQELAKKHGMRFSYRYTQKFYSRKLKEIFKGRPGFYYKESGYSWAFLFKRVSSVSIYLEKREVYTTHG